jgi:hypothetical protein
MMTMMMIMIMMTTTILIVNALINIMIVIYFAIKVVPSLDDYVKTVSNI